MLLPLFVPQGTGVLARSHPGLKGTELGLLCSADWRLDPGRLLAPQSSGGSGMEPTALGLAVALPTTRPPHCTFLWRAGHGQDCGCLFLLYLTPIRSGTRGRQAGRQMTQPLGPVLLPGEKYNCKSNTYSKLPQGNCI